MRRYKLLVLDVVLVVLATLLANVIRDNLVFSVPRIMGIVPFLISSAVAAAVIFSIMGLDRAIWRYSSSSDYWRLLSAMAFICSAALLITFAVNRMGGVARSMPILQFICGSALLIGAREFYRIRRVLRNTRKAPSAAADHATDASVDTVLVVGLSRLTELYLQSVAEMAIDKIHVAGVLGRSDRHVGRMFAAYPILGLPEDIERILVELQAHGEIINRIVVTSSPSHLTNPARDALLRIERSGAIELQFLAEQLGFDRPKTPAGNPDLNVNLREEVPQGFTISTEALEKIVSRPYWKVKRLIDVVGAAVLLVLLLPVFGLVGALVASNIGLPLVFWQQRPGLQGRPFRLLKFRTMGPAHAGNGRQLSDDERTSPVGILLRRLRMDELPQLLNILRGEMSFVGPRPLLPRDQSESYRARLLVRPGLTGWAQIVGGRVISAEDKAALDVWYVYNASFLLDIKIMLSTVPLVIFGERTSYELIGLAWRDLLAAGVLGNELSQAVSGKLGGSLHLEQPSAPM